MKYLTKEKILAAAVALIFVLGALIMSMYYIRLDVTSTSAFTVGEATKLILAEAKEDIQVTYYASQKLRASPIPQSVEDLLWEYAGNSGGRFKVKVIDPQESGSEPDLQRLQVQPQEIQVMEQNQMTVARVYSAIRLEYLGREEVLPNVYNPDNLEYELTSALRKLIRQDSRRIGVVLGNRGQSLENNWTVLNTYLKGAGELVVVDSTQPVDPGLDLLLVMGHKDLTEVDAYNVDQFFMGGRPGLLALDGVEVDISAPTLPALPAYPKPLTMLAESYGVKVEPALILDVYVRTLQFQSQQGVELKRYPFWFQIDPKTVNLEHPITKRFGGLDLMWASPLSIQEREGISVVRLLKSSDRSFAMQENLNVEPDMGMLALQMGHEKAASYNLALALSGTFKSAFSKETAPEGANTETFVAQGPENRIIVIGDSDWASDYVRIPTDIFSRNDASYNLEFLGSIVEWLSQDEMILQIKSRSLRPTELTGIRDEAGRNFADLLLKLVGIVLVPGLVIAFGVVRLVRRSRREEIPYTNVRSPK